MYGTFSRLHVAVLVALAALVISFAAVVPATARPAPTNLVKPSVAGKPAVGNTLTCRTGTGTGKASLRFAWKRDGQRVKHASGRHYRVTGADAGSLLRCAVRAARSAQRAVSAPVTVVDAPVNTGAPSIVGVPKPGQTLTCDPGTWTNDPTLRYAWTRDGSPSGTGPNRPTRSGDLGTRLVCLVAGSNIAGGSGSVASAAVLVSGTGTDPVTTTAPLNTVKPWIQGHRHPGITLTCDPGTWTGNPTFTFSWTRDGSPAGTGPTRRTRASDLGTTLVCLVAGSNAAGGSGGVASDPVLITPVQADHVAYQAITGRTVSAYASMGYAANQYNEWGDLIRLDAGPSELTRATVTMVSWACETGFWTGPSACVTTPGATFVHPLTLNVYAHDAAAPHGVGALLKTVTVDATIPYRPSADPACAGGRWTSPDLGCVNGLSADVSFDLGGVEAPEDVIVSVAFNTTNWGYTPVGGPGGPYDALNVAAIVTPPSVGTNVDPDATLLSSGTPTAPFVTDTGWGGYTPGIRLEAYTP